MFNHKLKIPVWDKQKDNSGCKWVCVIKLSQTSVFPQCHFGEFVQCEFRDQCSILSTLPETWLTRNVFNISYQGFQSYLTFVLKTLLSHRASLAWRPKLCFRNCGGDNQCSGYSEEGEMIS